MTSVQNAFIQIDGGTKGMMADLERRKFTAEEGDHLSLLNGKSIKVALLMIAYNAFIRNGQRDKQWCGNHRINHKALLRAVSIRKQLKKYLERFGIPIVSCEGDAVRLRKCLVSGYFKVHLHIRAMVKLTNRTQQGCSQMGRTVQLERVLSSTSTRAQ
jgi:ATP-dependent RNA helicase DDX35